MTATVVKLAAYGVVWVQSGETIGILRRETIHEHSDLSPGDVIRVRNAGSKSTPAFHRIHENPS